MACERVITVFELFPRELVAFSLGMLHHNRGGGVISCNLKGSCHCYFPATNAPHRASRDRRDSNGGVSQGESVVVLAEQRLISKYGRGHMLLNGQSKSYFSLEPNPAESKANRYSLLRKSCRYSVYFG